MSKKIVTHDGSFHTDEVFAVAILLEHLGEAEVVRSRQQDVIDSADYVVDVGLTYDPDKNHFDHHQPGGAGERENGIPYASFGLVWKGYGEGLAGGKRQAAIIDRELISPIDAHDNGVAIAEYKFKGVRDYAIGDFFSSYLTLKDEGPERLYEIFMNLVEIARGLVRREITKAREYVEGEDAIRKIYETSSDKRIIELPNEGMPWRETLNVYPEPIFVLYPRRDGKWGVKAVPDFSKPFGNNRKAFPSLWGGKSGEDLQRVTGVPDAIFAHKTLFMVAAESKEGAIELAKLALNA